MREEIFRSNGDNLPVNRNYDHNQMIPTNVSEFVDPTNILRIIRSIMFETNLLIEGDCGIGKTMSIMRIAMEDKLPFYLIQGTPDTRVEDLIGYPMQAGNQTVWIDGIIPRVLLCSQKQKCILFIDEINRLETNVQSVFFPLLDDRCSVVIHERGGEIIRGRKENLAVIATCNLGSSYYGINPLDRAFEDRFSIIKLDYLDPESETSLLQTTGLYRDLCKRMVEVANSIRELARDVDDAIAKPLSTRCLLRWAKIALRLNQEGINDPLMTAAEITVINRYAGQDQDRVRTIVEHLRGVSLDEEEEKKKRKSIEKDIDTDTNDLREILKKLDEDANK